MTAQGSVAAQSGRGTMAVALAVAAAIHAALLLGVDSPFPPLKAPVRSMIELTLTVPPSPQPIDEPAAAEAPPAPAEVATLRAEPQLATPDDAATLPETLVRQIEPQVPKPTALPLPPTLPGAYAGIVRDVAKLGASTPTQRTGPRVRRVDAALPQTNEDAYYLAAWRREVERVGNLNYPEAARAQKLYGQLRLLVAIAADGSLHDVRVLESSGHAVLDDAALHIVRLAAPYAPLPPAMRRETDVLEIVRTWQFQRRRGGFFDAA